MASADANLTMISQFLLTTIQLSLYLKICNWKKNWLMTLVQLTVMIFLEYQDSKILYLDQDKVV